MSKYNLVDLLNEYVGGGRIGTYPTTAMQLVQDMDDLERNNSNLEVRRTDGSGDGKVSIAFTVVEKGQDPSRQEKGFTIYDYKIGDWVDERGEYEGAMDYAEQEFDFSIGGNDLDLALKLFPGAVRGLGEGTCGYDRDAKTGKKLKGPGGLGKVNENIYVDGDEVKMQLKQYRDGHIDGDDLANAFDEIVFGDVKPPTNESTGPSDKAETEDDVVNVDKVAGPSAKGKGYGAETSANTAEDDQEDKEIQNPPPMYEDMSLTNLAKKLGIDVDELKDRIKKLQSTEKDKIEADAFSKSAVAEAKDWIQKAIKRPGALHRALDIPRDEDIPHSLINKDIKKMDDLEDEEGHLDKRDLRFLRQLDLAKTLEKFNESEEPGKLSRMDDIVSTLGEDDLEKIVAYMKERGRIKEEREVEYYPETFIDIATSYMKKRYDGRKLGTMNDKTLERLGHKIVDDKYDGDERLAYEELVDDKHLKIRENGDAEDFADELKEDKDEYKLRKQVINLVMKEKSVPISIAQEFFETHYDDIIDMNSDEILDEFDEYASVNFDSVPMEETEMEKLREHFKRFTK